MPKILPPDFCLNALIHQSRPTSITTELSKPTPQQLRVRLTEQDCNVAYYNWFMEKHPSVEYEDGSKQLLYADNIVAYVNAKDAYPLKGLYTVKPTIFLDTPACTDLDIWLMPTTSLLFLDGRIDNYTHRICVDKFNTISMTSSLSEAIRSRFSSYPTIQHAFDRGDFVYATTEHGTTRLQSIKDLDVCQIWGTDLIFEKRYLSFSKLDLL